MEKQKKCRYQICFRGETEDAFPVDWDKLNDDIFDNSMIHWVGMSKPEIEITENDMSKY